MSPSASAFASPVRKKPRLSHPHDDEAPFPVFGTLVSPNLGGTPAPSQRAPKNSQQTEEGRRSRMKAIADALHAYSASQPSAGSGKENIMSARSNAPTEAKSMPGSSPGPSPRRAGTVAAARQSPAPIQLSPCSSQTMSSRHGSPGHEDFGDIAIGPAPAASTQCTPSPDRQRPSCPPLAQHSGSVEASSSALMDAFGFTLETPGMNCEQKQVAGPSKQASELDTGLVEGTTFGGFGRALDMAVDSRARTNLTESDSWNSEGDVQPLRSSPNPFLSGAGFRTAASVSSADFSEDITSSTGLVATVSGLPGFTSASGKARPALMPSAAALAKAQRLLQRWDDEGDESSTLPVSTPLPLTLGFSTASSKGMLVPSVAALARAEEKRKAWDAEHLADDTSELIDASAVSAAASTLPTGKDMPRDDTSPSANRRSPAPFALPVMPDFASSTSGTISTIPQAPMDAPRPAESSFTHRPSTSVQLSTPARPASSVISTRAFATPLASPSLGGVLGKGKPRAFKSPLLPDTAAKLANSPLHPRHRAFSNLGVQPALQPPSTPVMESIPQSTPKQPSYLSSTYATPSRQPAGSKTRSTPRFSTPFKAGMAPGQSGRVELEQSQSQARIASPSKLTSKATVLLAGVGKGKQRESFRFFDLRPPPNRQTLRSSGLKPQSFTGEELMEKSINITELIQITPGMAMYYSFHSSDYQLPASASSTAVPASLGTAEALDELLRRGCVLATKPWVDNHWGLILWKLAGMVCLDPDTEGDPECRRWSWTNVIRQLLYRYERELEGGSRPPLRLVTTQDAPAGMPVVLCISNVIWDPPREGEAAVESGPQLEVTDGWYKLRAEVDKTMTRAISRGLLCPGKKIVVAGARLISGKREPCEILSAYDSCHLKLAGNSTYLAPWHTKLGYHIGPVVSGMASLSLDGGPIAVADVVIIKAHPIAFLEFFEDNDGRKRREGPRNEREERQLADSWQARRASEADRLREDMEKRLSMWTRRAERLERRAGSFAPGADDVAPDNLDDLYDEMEETTEVGPLIARLSAVEAGWLARCILDKCRKDREAFGETIEDSLKDICRPREIRNFRVLVVQDARPSRDAEPRRAQLTVWDVLSLSMSEGGRAGSFAEGQRFVVTNLIPSNPGAWMKRGVGSEIYLATRKDTRWRRVQ